MATNLRTGLRQSIKSSLETGLVGSNIFGTSTLDLRFAQQKSLGPRVTFTRASTGTFIGSDGLIKTATTNEPRFDHNPTTGESLGLLVEEARTNLQGNSGVLTAASWQVNRTTIATSGTGPDENTAYEITETTANGNHSIIAGGAAAPDTTSVTNGTVYTGSIFLKKSTVDWVQLSLGGTGFGSTLYINFNLNTGTIGNSSGGTGTITPYPNGWYRCTVTATATTTTAATNNLIVIFTNNSNTTTRLPSYTGSTSNKVFAAMGQFEAGTFVSSYIPTIGSVTATRAADVASITGSNFSSWYNAASSSIFAEWKNLAPSMPSGSFQWIAEFSDGTTPNRQVLFQAQAAATLVSQNSISGGTSAGRLDTGGSYVNTGAKAAAVFAALDRALVANGGSIVSSAVGALPIGINQASIGNQAGGGLSLNGTIKRLTYWPTRLSNTTLQQITR